MAKIEYLKNDRLPSVKEEFAGVPALRGRFTGEYDSRSGRKWRKVTALARFAKKTIRRETRAEQTMLPIIRDHAFLQNGEEGIMWLGHASFLIQIGGKRLLTDPCFSDIPLKKRLSPAPFHIRELGVIDYLLVSHGHHDHLDAKTLRTAGSSIREALLPLNMGRIVRRANRQIATQEAGWYQRYETKGVEVYLLPAHHWHRRNIFDYNRVLWGSFIIRSADITIYFAGDSGYNVHFKEIGEMFDIDYAIVPINPPYVISGSHMSQNECIRALGDLNAKHYIPMHYGTFKFNMENSHDLVAWFQGIGEEEGIAGKLVTLDMGEALRI